MLEGGRNWVPFEEEGYRLEEPPPGGRESNKGKRKVGTIGEKGRRILKNARKSARGNLGSS